MYVCMYVYIYIYIYSEAFRTRDGGEAAAGRRVRPRVKLAGPR